MDEDFRDIDISISRYTEMSTLEWELWERWEEMGAMRAEGAATLLLHG